ncbi:carbohydrate porin, partial [Piscinibacter sp.]|uniref:carbohydrate porin n=1 Tax=Piscinibacter sp. TaxID=1903157 RepID=UPI002C4BDF55
MSTTHHRVGFNRIAFAAALAGLFASTAVHAVDWGGYFRAGPGATKKDVSRACYGLNGPGLKYRLGNECDFYGE